MFLAGIKDVGPGFFSGRFWTWDERIEVGSTDYVNRFVRQLHLPYGVDALHRRPSVCQYSDRLYLVGGHSSNLVIDEHNRVWKQGIQPPISAPSVSGATGTGSFAYWSFWDEKTDEHSPLSASLEIDGDAVPRTWSNIPTFEPDNYMYAGGYINVQSNSAIFSSNGAGTATGTSKLDYMRPGDRLFSGSNSVALLREPTTLYSFPGVAYSTGVKTRPKGRPVQRASHVCLWLSYTGTLPRLIMKVRLGTTTVTESVAPANLGEAHPGDFERMPKATMNTIYHDRQVVAGDPKARDVVYLSAIGYPERYEGLSFRTRGGDAITGLIGTRDYCLVLTHRSTYIIQGYTEDDLKMDIADPEIGSAGHTCNTQINGVPYITSRSGIYLYNGSWHNVIQDSDHVWGEHFNERLTTGAALGEDGTSYSFASYYQNGLMVHNPMDKTIQLFMGFYTELGASSPAWFKGSSLGAASWVLSYDRVKSLAGGEFDQADVCFDALVVANDRQFTTQAFLYADDGGNAGMWHGTDDGFLYRELEEEPLYGSCGLILPAFYFDEAGGYEREGKSLVKFWSHVESENNSWKVIATGGGEWEGVLAAHNLAFSSATNAKESRMWMKSLGDGTLSTDNSTYRVYEHTIAASAQTGYAPLTTHSHPLPVRVSGRALHFIYVAFSPKGWFFRGLGGYYIPGPTSRPQVFSTGGG